MTNFFTTTTLFTFSACTLLGCLYAWFLYYKNNHLTNSLKYTLTTLRIVVVTLTSYFIFAPLFKQISYTLEKPIIVIANDNSISVAQVKPAGFNQKKYQQDLQVLVNKLSKNFEVKLIILVIVLNQD